MRRFLLVTSDVKQFGKKYIHFMPSIYSFIKYSGACIAIAGIVAWLALGQHPVLSYLIAGGCLMYLAIRIGEWWERD